MTIAAYLGIFILLALSVFQILLILGKPLGNYAWGGQHDVLPRKLRVASISSIGLYILFMIFLASKAGLMTVIPQGQFLSTTMWIMTVYFVLGIVMNGISRSTKERTLMTPVALVLALVFMIVSLGHS